MKRNRLRKAHNFMLKGITGTMFLLFMFSVSAIDSNSWLPVIMAVVSLLWLAVFAYANGYMGGDDDGSR